MNIYRSKPLTLANFTNDHIYITPFRDQLPVEVIGGTTRYEPPTRFVRIEHDNAIIETYVPTNNGRAGTFFQNRTFARSFFDKTGAALGDVVLFTEVAHLHFRLSLEKTAPIAVPRLTLRRTASAEEYATFLNDGATETELSLLRAHALGGEMSMGELAPAAGYSEFRPVNAAYGRLGRRLAEANGLTPLTRLNKTPIWFSVLAAWRDPQDAPERDDDAVSPQTALFRSYLHPEVIRGLHLAEHLSDAELRNALRKCAGLANEPSPAASHLPEHESLANALDPQTALEHAIAVMMAMTRRTAAQSNGQTVVRVVKNKELRVSDQALRTLLADLIKKQGGRCALSRLPLQYHGAHDDDQMLVSLDRIDGDGHYEANNLQVVCRFVNRWKSDMPDAEFRRLMDIVQTAGRE